MDKKDMINSIDIPNNLDEYVLSGIEKGRREKKMTNNNKKINNITKIAGVVVIGTVALGVANPEIIRAIPIIGKAIESFDPSTFGTPTDKYVEYAKGVNIVKENRKATVTLTDIIIDENEFMAGLIVESDALKGFTGKNHGDFVNVDSYIKLNGKELSDYGHKARKINDTTAAVIITSNIADMKLSKDVNVDILITDIIGEKEVKGKWEFKVNTTKVEGANRKTIGSKHEVSGQELVIKEVVTSPLSSTLILGGTDDTTNYPLQSTDFKVVDDKGNILKSNIVSSSVYNSTGEYFAKLSIDSNLENTKYIELIPDTEDERIYKETEGMLSELLTTTGSGDREETLISRKPTNEELKSGYALSKVYYYLNLDKDKEFLTIEDLKGYEIPVNNKDKVIIENIETKEEGTKVTMKIVGDYESSNLSQLVIFDENMKDTARWEGHIGAVLEDEKEDIYSITLDKIDSSKKYKIALPMTKDVDINSDNKIKIDL